MATSAEKVYGAVAASLNGRVPNYLTTETHFAAAAAGFGVVGGGAVLVHCCGLCFTATRGKAEARPTDGVAVATADEPAVGGRSEGKGGPCGGALPSPADDVALRPATSEGEGGNRADGESSVPNAVGPSTDSSPDAPGGSMAGAEHDGGGAELPVMPPMSTAAAGRPLLELDHWYRGRCEPSHESVGHLPCRRVRIVTVHVAAQAAAGSESGRIAGAPDVHVLVAGPAINSWQQPTCPQTGTGTANFPSSFCEAK